MSRRTPQSAADSLAQQLISHYMAGIQASASIVPSVWVSEISIIEPAKRYLNDIEMVSMAVAWLNARNWSVENHNSTFYIRAWTTIPPDAVGCKKTFGGLF